MTEQLATCIACRKDFDYTKHIVERRLSRPGVTQYGLQCPHCRFFVHAMYMDDDLRRRRERLAKSLIIYGQARNDRTWQAYQREKAAYQKAFERLNPPRVA